MDDRGRGDPPQQFEKGHSLDALIVAGLLIPQVLVLSGRVDTNVNDPFVGAYLLYVGLLFLASYYWSEHSAVLRGLIWICENFSGPRGRKMAFFYFALNTVLGLMGIFGGFTR